MPEHIVLQIDMSKLVVKIVQKKSFILALMVTVERDRIDITFHSHLHFC